MAEPPEIVFVCSTCYDLIDIRAELESELRDMGLVPILSDRPSSEFTIAPDNTSIESCLVNVRRADIVLVVLSQRYGPSLKVAGFDDISATHLEYREAHKHNKPIYFYVRDRLEVDYNIWKRNGKQPIGVSWVKAGDERIFDLLEEHRKLSKKTENPNWLWLFSDSVTLKQRVRKDLQPIAGKAIMRKLIDSGRMAYLVAEVNKWTVERKSKSIMIDFIITNAGTSAALQPFVSLFSSIDEIVEAIRTLLPGQSTTITMKAKINSTEYRNRNPVMGLECGYTLPEGHYIHDESRLEFYWEPRQSDFSAEGAWVMCNYMEKQYHHSSGIELSIS
jgi:hypothetical protein